MSQNPWMWTVAAAFLGSLGFGAFYNLRGRRLWIAALGGGLFWGFHLFLNGQAHNMYFSFFVSALLLTAYAELWAISLKTPVTVILMPTVIPFIPGGGLYASVNALLRGDMPSFAARSVNALLRGDMPSFAARSVETLGLALSLAVGIMVTTSLARPARLFLERLRH